jgi:DNA-binding NarL/FixJ family response regulator
MRIEKTIARKLTPKELETLQLVYSCDSIKEMAQKFHITTHAVKYRLHSIFMKLGVTDQKGLRRLMLGITDKNKPDTILTMGKQ